MMKIGTDRYNKKSPLCCGSGKIILSVWFWSRKCFLLGLNRTRNKAAGRTLLKSQEVPIQFSIVLGQLTQEIFRGGQSHKPNHNR